jgi:hypothetical protein
MTKPAVRLLLALLLFTAGVAHAAWQRTGQTPSGAVYRLAVPEGWRAGDGLVVYQHDLSFERDLAPDLGPLLDRQLAQGYAVAASGYSQAGWALFASGQDNRELVERFRTDIGEPGPILTYGRSMGGQVALQMAADPALAVEGALALCPVAAGSRAWDAALDLRVLYDAVCAGVDGGELPAAADRPWLLEAGAISAAGLEQVVLRSATCLGLGVAEDQRSADQRRRLARLKAVAGIDSDDLLLLNLGYATVGLSDLVRGAGKLAGRAALGNTGVGYGDPALDAGVRRIAADAFAALELRLHGDASDGGQARVVSLHASGDELAPAAHQHWLRQRLAPDRLSSALVADPTPAHCGISAAEGAAAWDALHAWVQSAPQPDAVELQARCLALADDGRAAGPCRIDAGLVPEPLDTALRPRARAVPGLDARFSGLWQDPGHPGEAWLVEVLDDRAALVYGLGGPAAGASGDQHWLFGTGRIDGDGIAVDQVATLAGGGFGSAFRAADARMAPWGQLRLVFDACGAARLRFTGPAGAGRGERTLRQVGHLGGLACAADAVGAAEVTGIGALSGSWYDPGQPGQGVSLQVAADGAATVLVFGYAPATGAPVWLRGSGRIDAAGRARFATVVRPHTDRSGTPVEQDWGTLQIDFSGCDQAVLRYRSHQPGYGSGELPLARLTRPLGLGACGLAPPAR